jgi:hypothetical protein
MGSNTSLLIPVLVALGFALTFWLGRKHDSRRILQQDFAAPGAPYGELVPCKVRFPLDEMSTPIVAKATPAGWYMVSPPDEVAQWRYTNNVPYLRQAILIPWSRLRCAPAKFPMHRWVKFTVAGTRLLFFVPKDAATTLLSQAGRTIGQN